MELLRRAGSARLAELLGADLFETDAAMVRAGVPALAAALEANADAETLAAVDRFVAGVVLADAEGAGSPEFLLLGASPAPFTRSDVFAIGALMAFDSANNMDNELLRLALTEALGERAELFLQGDRVAIDQPWVVGERASAPGAIEALAKIVDALAHPQRPVCRPAPRPGQLLPSARRTTSRSSPSIRTTPGPCRACSTRRTCSGATQQVRSANCAAFPSPVCLA